MSKGRRVLVTGAGGFIGRAVVRHRPRHWQVVAISSQCSSLDVDQCLTVGDLEHSDADELGDLDAVIHLAGNANHAMAQIAPWDDVRATALVAAEVLGRLHAKQLVVLSSAAVYAGLEGLVGPGAEREPAMPYAISKLYVEALSRVLQHDGRYEKVAVFRLYNAFGPGEKAGRLIPRIASAVQSHRTFQLTGDPSSLSDPLHVENVARALSQAVEGGVNGTYDLCGGDPRPLPEQVRRVAACLGAPDLEVESRPPRPGETPIRFWSDPTDTWHVLGVPNPEPFESSVLRYARVAGWLPS